MMELLILAAAMMLQPSCEIAPGGSDQNCIDCYEFWCDAYTDDWNACTSLPQAQRVLCRNEAKVAYQAGIKSCPCPVVSMFTMVMPDRVIARLDGIEFYSADAGSSVE